MSQTSPGVWPRRWLVGPRQLKVAIYLMRHLRRDRLKQIGEQFQMKKYSTVSSVIERMKKKLKTDRKLSDRINAIADLILKSQEQT